MSASHSRSAATVYGVAAILLWSSLAVVALSTNSLPPFQVLAISFAIGGATGIFATAWRQGWSRAAFFQPWPSFVVALIALFGYHALYFIAFRHAPAIEANLINYLWPLLIVVFAAFVPGNHLSIGQIVGTLLGLAGVLLMVTRAQGFSLDPAFLGGYLAAAGAALTWSAYSILNRRFNAVPSSAISVVCLCVALLAAIVHCVFEVTLVPNLWQTAMLVLMGIGPVGIAFLLWDHGTKHGDIAVLGTLSYAAPVLSTLLLLLSGRVQAHWTQAAALALLLVGAWLSVRSAKRENNN
jgi:drug/metabolite transporter (DMT)-like permease